MENTGFKVSSVFFILYIYRMKKIMKEKNQVVPNEVLRKEFLSQFKTEADVSKFLKQLHAQVLEKMLEGEMDAHLGYEKNSVADIWYLRQHPKVLNLPWVEKIRRARQ